MDVPILIDDSWRKHIFRFGPATSSVWSTPSYDAESNTIFFGTDVLPRARRPTFVDATGAVLLGRVGAERRPPAVPVTSSLTPRRGGDR